MPLKGGASDKLGNYYEAYWTVKCMAQVLNGDADTIQLEPLGPEGEGVEFCLQKGNIREYHQVKRQLTGEGRWQFSQLEDKKVLSHFRAKLDSSSQAECHFISTHSAYQLEELTNRARSANSWQEFDSYFIDGIASRKDFEAFQKYWGNKPPLETYADLKRMFVHTNGEIPLRELVNSLLVNLILGDSQDIINYLIEAIPNNLHKELRAYDLAQIICKNPTFQLRDYQKNLIIIEAMTNQTQRYINSVQDTAALAKLLLREEATQITNGIKELSSPKQGILVAGDAGFSKSILLVQVIKNLQEMGWPVLAFRLDRLMPTALPSKVGEQLGLPESPVKVLANLAKGQTGLLVVDQLDAVSLASARQSSFFDCITELIQELRQYPNLRILMACRNFDLANDYRLRGLLGDSGIADEFSVNQFSPEQVKEILNKLGLIINYLSPKQLELLSVPLHLGLLATIAQSSAKYPLNFDNVKDLFDLYWKEKKRALYAKLGIQHLECDEAIAVIAEYLSNEQRLFIPVAKVKKWEELVDGLKSENVLVREQDKYAFFHESFFDYAFAYNFTAGDQDLITMLLKDEQHLFRRAQVRQILLHERDGDRERYLKDLKILVTDPRIRFHLKRVVFALLRSLTDPTKEEWQIIVAMMNGEETPNSNNSLTWSVLFGSAAWFNLLDNDFGLIEMWLSRKAAAGYTATTVSLMATVSQQLPERVAELAEKYYDASEQWQDYILNLAYEDSLLQNRRFFELFLRLVDVGVFTNRGVELWQYLYSLVKNRPAWACEVLGKYLPLWLNYISKMTNLSLEQDATPNLSKKEAINITNLLYYSHRSSGLDEGIFLACAERAPTEFVKQLFPFFINIIEATLVKEYAPPWPDRIWPYGPDDIIVSLRDLIFCNIEKALILIAHHSLPLYLQIEEEYNLYNLDYKTIRYLLGKIYASKGQQFADKAINYLCKFPDKLDIGNSGDSRKITRELLQAVTPYCSDITLVRLEQLVLAYNPDWEIYFESSHLRNSHGCAQYILLGSIASTRLSPLASRRFAELQRKFGSTLPVQPPSGAGFMHSPISDETAAKMSNKQWLKAIVRYHDDYNPNFVYNHFVGGARELAGVLERCTKQEPERFATLILHLPDNTNHFYFEAILRGISGTGLALDKILVSCERVHNLPQHPCGRAICDLISYSSAESNLPQVFVKMLGWYAIQDIDPTVETWRVDSQNSTEYYGGNIVQAGLNSVRGNAASVMAQLIFADPQRASLFLPYIQQMVNDPKVSVRARIVEVLTSMLNYDRDQAVALFVVLCNAEDALFRVQALENFLRYTLVSHLTNLTPILQRMLSSSLPEVVEAGIRLSYELKLYFDGSQEFLEVCKTGNYIQRLTLSDVSARGLNITKYQSSCEEYLGQLFYDEKLEVRAKAASCFTFLADDKLGNFTNLIERFVKSPSFNEHYGDLIRALERTTTKLPDLTCLICEQLLTNFDNMVGNITTQIAYHAQTLGHLIVRIYEQTDSSEVKQRCLNLLDEMLRKKVYNLEIVLEEYRRG